MAALNRLVGIAKVKEQVEQFVAMAEFNQNGLNKVASSKIRPCTLFLGNPGTGKTTVARILGNIPFQKGVIKEEIHRSIAEQSGWGYQGQTALKTRGF